MSEIRYGDYVKESSLQHNEIDYSDLVLNPEDSDDTSVIRPKPKLRSIDIYRLLKPYISVRFMDQFKSVVPLSLYLMLFQVVVLRQGIADTWTITAGLFGVIVGLMFFLEGLKLGLMPFGESIGHSLPIKSPLLVVVIVTFLLGVGVTFAEPAIGALQAAGSLVDVEKAPYLYSLLNFWTLPLIFVVGAGVGIAAVLGILRFIYGWSLKPFIYFTIIPTLLLTVYFMQNANYACVLGLAWDCGAVTTGPVTVPLVLSLGIGVAAAAGKGENSLSGFGIVTLASIFPIMGVMLLTLFVGNVQSIESILALANELPQSGDTRESLGTPYHEIVMGIRAIIPLVLFLWLVLKVILKESLPSLGIVVYGIILAVLGMIIINLGLSYGLSKLGAQSGSLVPAAFSELEHVPESPLYIFNLGLFIAIVFAWFLGFGATMAEPALNALGMTVESLTNGAFKKSLLMYSVSFGVAFGLGIGVCKVIFDFPLAYLILSGYCLGLVMTFLSSEEFVNVAWDSAGVTTGPVTVPLVLSMGLGFGGAVNAIDGFGILAMASICPIISVLGCGLYIQFKAKTANKKMLSKRS